MTSIRNAMRPVLSVLLGVMIAAGGSLAWPVAWPIEGGSDKKDKNQPEVRDLSGEVMDTGNAPLENAIVHLKNRSTQTEKSLLTGKDGSYHFPGLSTSVDYELYAELQGRKSETRTLSALDGRERVILNLTINPAKP